MQFFDSYFFSIFSFWFNFSSNRSSRLSSSILSTQHRKSSSNDLVSLDTFQANPEDDQDAIHLDKPDSRLKHNEKNPQNMVGKIATITVTMDTSADVLATNGSNTIILEKSHQLSIFNRLPKVNTTNNVSPKFSDSSYFYDKKCKLSMSESTPSILARTAQSSMDPIPERPPTAPPPFSVHHDESMQDNVRRLRATKPIYNWGERMISLTTAPMDLGGVRTEN